MSESPERENAIAQGAIAEMLRRHQAQGNSVAAMLGAMADVADHGMEKLLGSERMAHLHRNKADSAALRASRPALNLADPTPEDARIYAAKALDDAPAALDRDGVYLSAVIHGGLSLAARRGAAEVMAVLSDLFAQIKAGAIARHIRSGDPAHDYN